MPKQRYVIYIVDYITIMAVNILAQLGFSFKKSSTTAVVNNITNVKQSLLSLSPVFAKVEQRIDSLNNVAKWTAAGAAIKDFSSSIKAIATSTVSVFKKQFDFVSSFAVSGDKIAKTSRLVGLSVKDYQAFSSAAKHAGFSVDEIDSALAKFNVNLGKARSGDKESLKMFNSLLPKGKRISDYKDSVSILSAVADGYKKLSSAEQKAFVSQGLFGKTGLKMSELLKNGGDDLKKQMDSAVSGFSEDGAKNAELFNDELQDLRETLNSLKISVAEELFPTFISLFKDVKLYINENKKELIPLVKTIFASIADFVKKILPKIPTILDKILSIVNMIGPEVLSIGAAFFTILPVLAQIFTAVKVIILTFGAPLLGAIGGVLILLYEMYSIGKQFYENWEMFSDFIRNDLKNSFGVVGKFLDWLGDFFADKIFRIYKIVENFNFDNLFGSLKMAVLELGSMIYDSIFGSIGKAFDAAKSLLKKIPGFGSLFGDDSPSISAVVSSATSSGSSSASTVSDSAAKMISESRTTVINRFAVDFKNMPRGVVVTPPEHGDFDYSRGYMLGGI